MPWHRCGAAGSSQASVRTAAGLKHAFGLAKNRLGRFTLLYLYYDDTGGSDIANRHRAEIERFATRVDTSLGFRALSYQMLFAGLCEADGVDGAYIEYPRERYL